MGEKWATGQKRYGANLVPYGTPLAIVCVGAVSCGRRLFEDREVPQPRMQSDGAAGDARHHKGAESPPWRDFHENKGGCLQLGS